jgi:hypothetical protein
MVSVKSLNEKNLTISSRSGVEEMLDIFFRKKKVFIVSFENVLVFLFGEFFFYRIK